MVTDDLSPMTCPRCGVQAAERFYGPCATCRQDLRDTQKGQGRVVVAEVYEPKMNVTPNSVASRD